MPRTKRKLKSLFVYDEGLRTREEESAVEFIVGLEDLSQAETNSIGVPDDYLEERLPNCMDERTLEWWTQEDYNDDLVGFYSSTN
jgi:hypothetical protein